jgi:hypothetical protein
MAFVLAGSLSNRRLWWHLCWRSFMWPASTNGSVLVGGPPAYTKGHFYWLKVAGGCRTSQQRPVLAARTNRFWPSEWQERQDEVVNMEPVQGRASQPWSACGVWLVYSTKPTPSRDDRGGQVMTSLAWRLHQICGFCGGLPRKLSGS